MSNAHSYSLQIFPVLSTLSFVNALKELKIGSACGKKKSAYVALFSGWVAGTYLNLSHPGVGPAAGPTPDSLGEMNQVRNPFVS